MQSAPVSTPHPPTPHHPPGGPTHPELHKYQGLLRLSLLGLYLGGLGMRWGLGARHGKGEGLALGGSQRLPEVALDPCSGSLCLCVHGCLSCRWGALPVKSKGRSSDHPVLHPSLAH